MKILPEVYVGVIIVTLVLGSIALLSWLLQ